MKADIEDKDPYRAQTEKLAALQQTDPVAALEGLTALAPRSITSMLQLGWSHEKGLGTPVNNEEAKRWYARAAEKGAPSGYFYLGNLYLGKRDYVRAREAFAASADLGHTDASEALRRLDAWQGRETQVTPVRRAYELLKSDPVNALDQLRHFAADGSALAMFYLGYAHQKGLGTAPDLEEAERWYRSAYECGTEQTRKDAANYLAHLYYLCGHQYQKTKSYEKARECFQAGTDLAYGPALFRLGRLYARALGVNRDLDKARTLFEQAIDLGNLPAKRDLAKLYMSGRLGLRNIFKGLRLFREAMQEIYAVSGDSSSERLRG